MKAAQVREAELRALAREGFPVEARTRWLWVAGDLSIWPAAGWWMNTRTGERGKMYGVSLRELIERHNPPKANAAGG